MPAVQLLQEGVVCAFGEAALLVDKSQHAQFLKRKARQEGAQGETVMTELVTVLAAAFISTNVFGQQAERKHSSFCSFTSGKRVKIKRKKNPG